MEMYSLAGKLLIIKERSVYEFKLADNIDPHRQNPNLPLNISQRILTIGTESEIFSRTFLTAKRLLNPQFLDVNIDTEKAINLALEVIKEIVIMNNEIDNYNERISKKLSFQVPSISDVNTRCKTIFQKVDQIFQAQFDIIRIFYHECNEKFYYSDFVTFLKEKYGESDVFTKFMQNIFPFIKLVRDIRNCLDHRRVEIQIKNFEIQQNSTILTPTIEINYNRSKLNQTRLAYFLPIVRDNLVTIFENMIVNLCSKKIKIDESIPIQILFIPEEQRINKFIKYAFWLQLGDKGYYYQ